MGMGSDPSETTDVARRSTGRNGEAKTCSPSIYGLLRVRLVDAHPVEVIILARSWFKGSSNIWTDDLAVTQVGEVDCLNEENRE